MTARTDPMRRFDLKSGTIDVRHEDATDRFCLVFDASEFNVQLFRTMSRAEAELFHQHLGARLTHTARSGGNGDSK